MSHVRRIAAALLIACLANLSFASTVAACMARGSAHAIGAGCHPAEQMAMSHSHASVSISERHAMPSHDGECCVGVATCGTSVGRMERPTAMFVEFSQHGQVSHADWLAPRASATAPEPPPPRA